MLLLKSNFHALFLCKKNANRKNLNLEILVPALQPRVVAFVRAFMMLHVNFFSLGLFGSHYSSLIFPVGGWQDRELREVK